MRHAATTTIVEIWEELAGSRGVRRTHALLSIFQPSGQDEDLFGWPLGRCNERLLTLHESLFGDDLTSVADCPQCHRRIEAEFTTGDLRQLCDGANGPSSRGPAATATTGPEASIRGDSMQRDAGWSPGRITIGGREARVPCLGDLVALETVRDGDTFARELVKRCRLPDIGGMDAQEPTLGDDEILSQFDSEITRWDPWADLHADMDCPACGARWAPRLDVAAYLWEKIEYWAGRVLDDVHALALRYHWSQREILAMSPARRQYYLERGVV